MRKIATLIALLIVAQVNVGNAQMKTSTDDVLNTYYQVKNALASDDGSLAAKDATLLASQISDVKTSKLSAAEKEVWIKQSKEANTAAKAIAASTDIANQRTLFASVSNAMIVIVKTLKPGKEAVYLQYCPMAKKSWLNEKAAIENPYYGKSMFECGTVKEVIKK